MNGPLLPFESPRSRARFTSRPSPCLPPGSDLSPAARRAALRQRHAHRRGWTVQAYEDHLRLARDIRNGLTISLSASATCILLLFLATR